MTVTTEGAASGSPAVRASGRGSPRAGTVEQLSRADRVARGKDARAVAPLESPACAGASGAPLRCGIVSIAPGALERTATELGIKSHLPGEGEFRVAPVVDRGRLGRALDLLSYTVNHRKDAALTKREADAIERAFLEIAVRSLGGDSSRSSPYQPARLTSAKIVRTCEDHARNGGTRT